jgi:hypothetical protein
VKILASRLRGWNFLQKDVKLSYRKGEQLLSPSLSKDGELVYCKNAEGYLQELGYTHNSEKCRFFVHSFKFRLKLVLLHNGKIHLSILTAHSTRMKETHKNMDLLLKLTQNMEGSMWKPHSFLLRRQSGYTKSRCFLCELYSRT